MAGGHRRRPEMAGSGRRWPKSGSQAQAKESASLAHFLFLEFYKRSFGERTNSSSERARRGEENGMVVGGQGGVYGGGEGGETLELNGFMVEK